MTYYTAQPIDSYRFLGVAFHPHAGIMVTLNREREKEMQKQDLIEVIKKFAALPENQRTEFTINGERRKTDVIWDFVGSDIAGLETFKASSFTHQDLDEAMGEVAAKWIEPRT